MKGSKTANKRNHLKSLFRIFIILPASRANPKRKGIEMSRRIKTMAIGSKDSLANLNATNVIPQNTMARVTLKMTQNFFNE